MLLTMPKLHRSEGSEELRFWQGPLLAFLLFMLGLHVDPRPGRMSPWLHCARKALPLKQQNVCTPLTHPPGCWATTVLCSDALVQMQLVDVHACSRHADLEMLTQRFASSFNICCMSVLRMLMCVCAHIHVKVHAWCMYATP